MEKDRQKKRRKSETGAGDDQWIEKDGVERVPVLPPSPLQLLPPMFDDDEEDDEVGPHLPGEAPRDLRKDRAAYVSSIDLA